MRKGISWSTWSITIKILIPFLGLSIISMGVVGYLAFTNISGLGHYALQTSTALGETAIQDSTKALTELGENTIKQIARDVAKQVEMFLEAHPGLNTDDMRHNQTLRDIIVQSVGITGYTTLIDPNTSTIIVHKYAGQEKNIGSLMDSLPSFGALIRASIGSKATSGYYDWQEVDGSIRQKYASIAPIKATGYLGLTLWATTYIDEFSQPAEETKKEINAAILDSSNYINDNVSKLQNLFMITVVILVLVVTVIALLLSWVITSPILALQRGAEAIGEGRLDYQLMIKNRDELGDLANSFNKMSSALNRYMEELKNTAADNIAKEKRIQENLRLYVQKISQAEETERRRIARELHDETAQALIVVARHLDDLSTGNAGITAQDIRNKVRTILEGVRRFSQELRPSILDDLGLIPAINWLASDLNKNFGIKVETEITGNQRPLPPDSELMLFRIVQEALTNIRKHSQATEARVKLEFGESNTRISVRDNGIGFEMPSRIGDFARTSQFGLIGMQERVQLLGGIMEVHSQPGDGTTLTVQVPL